jgi:hypothetical protein
VQFEAAWVNCLKDPISTTSGVYLSSQLRQEPESLGDWVPGQPGREKKKKKFQRPHLNGKKRSMVVCTCNPSNSGKLKIGLWSRSDGKNKRSYLQKNQSKKLEAWLDCLPHKAQSPELPTIFFFPHVLADKF